MNGSVEVEVTNRVQSSARRRHKSEVQYKETKMALNLTTTANPVRTWKNEKLLLPWS